MENWLILSKLTIVAYCILVYAGNEMRNPTAFVLFMLIYVCVNMGLYIVKKDRLKTGLLLVSILVIAGCFVNLNFLFKIL